MNAKTKMGMERMTKNAFVGMSNAQKVRMAIKGSELTIAEISQMTKLPENKVRNVIRYDFTRGIALNAGRLGKQVLYTLNSDRVCMVMQIVKTKNIEMPQKRAYTKDCASGVRKALYDGPKTQEQITKMVGCNPCATGQHLRQMIHDRKAVEVCELPHHGMRGRGKRLYALSDGNGGIQMKAETFAQIVGKAHA